VGTWLDPLRAALDEAPHPARFFFRDDDAGWNDERLFALLDIFANHGMPIDLAVIPSAVTPRMAEALSRRMMSGAERIRIHQHGFAHINHEPAGRKCEFGSARGYALQRADIEEGKARLSEFFGPLVDPIFTPPWNRCTNVTGRCLVELGFRVLSRESNATPLEIAGLQELPIHQDWFAHRKGVRLSREQWANSLGDKVKLQTPVGVMFHHAVMDSEDMRATAELVSVLAGHRQAESHAIIWFLDGSRI
jgi:predicted deacetylase